MSEIAIFSLAFGGVGFILAALALFFWLRTRAFLDNAQKAQGTVIRMVYSSDSEGGGGYSPVYTFRTMSGQVIEKTDSMSSNPPQFKEGQTIDVLYDLENPNKARINKWFNHYSTNKYYNSRLWESSYWVNSTVIKNISISLS